MKFYIHHLEELYWVPNKLESIDNEIALSFYLHMFLGL